MKIFISWSGERSKAVATSLRNWFPKVIQSLKPWISTKDIDKGHRWLIELSERLQDTYFGIICLTPENLNASWLLFEAGSLSKAVSSSSLCPVLLDLEPTDVVGPLSQFQLTKLNKEDLYSLILAINKSLDDNGSIPEEQLRETFEVWWPRLKSELETIPPLRSQEKPPRDQLDILQEILEIVRLLARESPIQQRQLLSGNPEDLMRILLATLTPRQEVILRMVYGLGCPAKSIQQIAQKLNVSNDEVERTHAKALKIFATPHRLKAFLGSFGHPQQDECDVDDLL